MMKATTIRRYLASNRRALGALGERMAAHLLKDAGYQVKSADSARSGDLRAILSEKQFRVEVKTARRGRDSKWHFTIRKNDQYGHTDYRDSDVVVLLAVLRSGRCVCFVIPAGDIPDQQTHISITSHPERYAGRWAEYRQGDTIRLH